MSISTRLVRPRSGFAAAPTPAELENAKARFLGKGRPRDRTDEGPRRP